MIITSLVERGTVPGVNPLIRTSFPLGKPPAGAMALPGWGPNFRVHLADPELTGFEAHKPNA
jgi:hypothetical protein